MQDGFIRHNIGPAARPIFAAAEKDYPASGERTAATGVYTPNLPAKKAAISAARPSSKGGLSPTAFRFPK